MFLKMILKSLTNGVCVIFRKYATAITRMIIVNYMFFSFFRITSYVLFLNNIVIVITINSPCSLYGSKKNKSTRMACSKCKKTKTHTYFIFPRQKQ